MAGQRDLDKVISVANTIAPAAARTAHTTGTGVDLAGYRAAVIVLHCGVFTDGTFTPIVEESDSSGSGYTTVAAGDLSGSFTAVTSANDDSVQEVGYLGSKRYVRLYMEETSASTGALFSAVVVRGNPVSAPV